MEKSQERIIVYFRNEKECLEYCLSMSNDKEFQKKMRQATHEERVVFMLDNGFTFDGLTDEEADELERLYREEVKNQQKQHDSKNK